MESQKNYPRVFGLSFFAARPIIFSNNVSIETDSSYQNSLGSWVGAGKMKMKQSSESEKPSFREVFKSNFSRRWPIFLGLVIADYLLDFFTGGGLSSFGSVIFLVNSLIGSLIIYVIIVAVISSIKRRIPSYP